MRLRLKFIWIVISVITLGIGLLPLVPAAAQEESEACAPAKEGFPPGETTRRLIVSGGERSYLLHIPSGYDPSKRYPLVLSFHGFTSNSEDQSTLTRFGKLADSEGFIVVFPQGLAVPPFPPRWNAGITPFMEEDSADDVGFVKALLDDLEATLCVDTYRIYANGFSNGAGFVHRLACELSDRITAIGGVSGAYLEQKGGCNPVRAVPIIAFHSDTDPVARIEGIPAQGAIPVRTWIEGWVERNGCSASPEALEPIGAVEGTYYSDCKDGVEVVFYLIKGAGHTWAGGRDIPFVGATNRDISASEVMWSFFKQYTLQGAVQ